VASATEGRVTVRVIDRGRGIPNRDRQHVFEPFFRGRGESGGDSASGGGSGLGLAICRGFVEANGGQIALQTAVRGETSFAVSFPLLRQPETVG
jgi:signal transduction histidine kinase